LTNLYKVLKKILIILSPKNSATSIGSVVVPEEPEDSWELEEPIEAVQLEGLDVDLTGELNEWFKRQVEKNLHRGGIENVVFRMWTDVQRGEHFRTRNCNRGKKNVHLHNLRAYFKKKVQPGHPQKNARIWTSLVNCVVEDLVTKPNAQFTRRRTIS
jgi:hypothetical protein